MDILDILYWLERLNDMADLLKKESKGLHEPYDNFGGTNMELIEIAIAKEIERIKNS